MSTPGFEDWTIADVERLNEQRRPRVRADIQPDAQILAHAGDAVTPLRQSSKQHKYRARPCIVTADLTLFTREDLQQLAYSNGRPDMARSPMSLKALAFLVDIQGDWFGSTKEAKRWIELRRMEAGAGRIRSLRRQVPYPLMVNDVTIGKWIADFVYDEWTPIADTWVEITEDCKGLRTALYRRSKAHVEAQYRFAIRET